MAFGIQRDDDPLAHQRLKYLTLMPRLGLWCIIADSFYLSFRIFFTRRQPSPPLAAFIFLFIEATYISMLSFLNQ